MRLEDTLNNITTRQDFVAFAQKLQQDYRQNPETWENNTLVSFLGAIAAWVDDLDGYYTHLGEAVPQQPSWKLVGQILLAASIYE